MTNDKKELYVWLDGEVTETNQSKQMRDRISSEKAEDTNLREHIDLIIRKTDLFPPDRLDQMLDNASRDETTLFIHLYYDRITHYEPVPNHWHIFAAALLRKASDAINGDYDTHKGALAKVMGLQGRKSLMMRNDLICFAIQQQIDRGETPSQSQKVVAGRVNIDPNSMRRKIWDERNVANTEEVTKLDPDTDFLEILAPAKK